MRSSKVALIAPPAVACKNPRDMEYGGVERVAWRLTRMLAELGAEPVPVASADSEFGPTITARGLSSEESWCRTGRTPPAFGEDADDLLARFGDHAGKVIEAEEPNAVLLLGPSVPVLTSTLEAVPPDCRVGVILHNGPHDNTGTVPILNASPTLALFSLSQAQRAAFGSLARRIELLTDGIPIGAIPFSPDPAVARAALSTEPAFADIPLRPERPLIGQIDYFHPHKAMLTTLRIFRDSGKWRTHDLLLAGGPGWQLPSRRPRGDSYLDRLQAFVANEGLADCVHISGALPGWKVARLHGCMDVCVSPVHLEAPIGERDPESYGQGRAIANSAGTPVLMSTAYDESFAARSGLRFGNATEGAQLLAEFSISPEMRNEMRAFAEKRDGMTSGLELYAQFIGVAHSSASIRAAVETITRLELDGETS